VSSLIYHLFGLDVYSFMTRFGNPNIPSFQLKVLNKFSYEVLTSMTQSTCVVTNDNLYKSSQKFARQNKSSLPISVHDIIRLNEEFQKLQNNYTKIELEMIVGDKVF